MYGKVRLRERERKYLNSNERERQIETGVSKCSLENVWQSETEKEKESK